MLRSLPEYEHLFKLSVEGEHGVFLVSLQLILMARLISKFLKYENVVLPLLERCPCILFLRIHAIQKLVS
jgi:hypothetical protein